MHSRKKGKAGSTRPVTPSIPSWITYKPQEVEQLVVKLAKGEKSPSQVGMTLRDSYGIPDVKIITKKTVMQILKEGKAAPKLPEDMLSLIKRYIAITKHLEKNHKDMGAARGLHLTLSKINRLSKYYKRKKTLAADWQFEPSKAKLLLE